MSALIVLSLQALLLIPLVYVGLRVWSRLRPLVAAYCVGFVAMLATVTAASPVPASLTLPPDALSAVNSAFAVPEANVASADGAGAPQADSECAQVLEMSQKIDLFDRPAGGVLRVNGNIWQQFPEAARAVLLHCISEEYVGGGPLRVEQR